MNKCLRYVRTRFNQQRVMLSKSSLLASIFLILANLLAHGMVQKNWCTDLGNTYASDSTYEVNLDTLLSSLSTNVDYNGFYNASMGQSPNTVYAYALCRGDVRPETCRSCVQTAATEIVKSCPNKKRAVWLDEFCTLRYTYENTFGAMEDRPMSFFFNLDNASSPDQYIADVRRLLNKLGDQAAGGGSLRKVAAGNMTSLDDQTIFSLVQCTPDLSPESCSACLREAADLSSRCDDHKYCRVLKPSCNICYGVSSFYNETRLQELQALVIPTSPAQQQSSSSPPSGPSLPSLQPPTTPGTNDQSKNRIIIVVSIIVCLTVAVCVGIFLIKRTKKKRKEALEYIMNLPDQSLQYDFRVIKAATNDFSSANMLGKGGFGSVYKGKLPNGQEIAVKRMSTDSGQGGVEFKNEVSVVVKLQHRNLVRLLGFSMEEKERILIYEFIENTSLDRFIFNPVKHNYLDWETRHQIIKDISRGLRYLHEESRYKIIHRDLKASNILLDGEMKAKIADFGTAKLCALDETHGNTKRNVGSYGYMSPEYAMHGQFSVKSDVYSFGVLVLEIITGQRNSSFRQEDNTEDLLSMTWKCWRQRTIEDIIDPKLKSSLASSRDQLVRSIHVGLLCVQDNPSDRPTMASVVMMLSSFDIRLSAPSEPVFFTKAAHTSNNTTMFSAYDSKGFDLTKSSSQKISEITLLKA